AHGQALSRHAPEGAIPRSGPAAGSTRNGTRSQAEISLLLGRLLPAGGVEVTRGDGDTKPVQGKPSGLTRESFEILLAQLDPDRERAGELYETIRRKLIRLFEWRGCACPEDLADETFNRGARQL